MTRRIFPSFHYEKDIWRTNTARNSWVTQDIDAELEVVKRQGDDAIKRWIKKRINNTSVTTVLIGEETHDRKWVNHEIEKSIERGNGLVGVYIDKIKDKDGRRSSKGPNPLSGHDVNDNGLTRSASSVYDTYDWVRDNGYKNLGDWVESAATTANNLYLNDE